MTHPPFEKFVKNPDPRKFISLDPGGTTGYAIWDECKLVTAGQHYTTPVYDSIQWLKQFFDDWNPAFLVVEEYRVYAHKVDDHAQNDMHTSRLIGAIECLAALKGIPLVMQGAGLAKGFVKDDKLETWDFWRRGEKHARDALRHGAYYLCFGKSSWRLG